MKTSNVVGLTILLMLFAVLACFSLNLGGSNIGFFDLWHGDETGQFVLFHLRIPRTLSVICVGAALGLSGVLLQMILNNPLAEPYTLGLSGGATLGSIVTAMLLPLPGAAALALGSILGCWCITFFILSLLKRLSVSATSGLILAGVMLSLACGSVVSVLMAKMNPAQFQRSFNWMVGYFGTDRDQYWNGLAPLVAASVGWSWWRRKDFDRWLLGEEWAASFGINYKKLKREVLIAVTLLVSISVAISGLVGFVGLLAPHITHKLFGTRRFHWQIPGSVLTGAILLLLGDVLGRWVGGNAEIPAGSLVALLGAPTLIFFILRGRRNVA
jgi:ABC-type Fe3+-siderophore transport system permease subunit